MHITNAITEMGRTENAAKIVNRKATQHYDCHMSDG